MDIASITLFGTIFAIFVGFSSILADTFQVADSIEKRRKKSQGISKETENCELVHEKLNKCFTNKQEKSLSPELSKYEPPLGWEEDIKKSFAEAKENLKSKKMASGDGKKILIVDDECIVRGNIQEFLEIEGYEVLPAEDAESAFKILEHEIPDLIISDVMMPGIDGYDFTKIVRKTPHVDWIPIILMSAYKCKSIDRVKGLNAGAVAYLNKPFNSAEFIAQIKSSLKQTEILINRPSAFDDL